MSETRWFNRRPGEAVSQGEEDHRELLVGLSVPDWIRTPPELGSQPRRVVREFRRSCPKCRSSVPARHFELAGGLYVAECPGSCGFVWYRLLDAEDC